MGILHEDIRTSMIGSRRILPTVMNVSDTSCRENQNTHFMFHKFFFEKRAGYEMM